MKKKKAVSPIIATVLLIMIVIVLAIIILLWATGFVKEAITKDVAGVTKKADQFCSEISIETSIGTNSITIKNNGNIPIYAFNAKLSNVNGETLTQRVDGPLNAGNSINLVLSQDYSSYEEVKLIPILLGKTKSGATQEVECSSRDAIVV